MELDHISHEIIRNLRQCGHFLYFKTGGKDEWIKLGTVTAGTGTYQVDLSKLPSSKFYKFVVESPNNHLNRWVK